MSIFISKKLVLLYISDESLHPKEASLCRTRALI